MQNNINLNQFIGKVKAYRFTFMPKSITGRLIENNGDYITVETKSGSLIVAQIDSLISIWHINPKRSI